MTNEQLVSLIKEGIDVSENMLLLWEQNRGIIGKIACSYRGYEEMDDLKQQGYIGLCNAVAGYQEEENVPFINYAALWIRQSMARYIENCGSVVRIPSHEKLRQNKYRRIVSDFKARTGREPTDQEICRCMEISPGVLQEIKKNTGMGQIGSLDEHVGEDGDTTLGELVASDIDIEEHVLDKIQQKQLQKLIWPVVDALPGIEPQVIRSRYQEGKTLKEIGDYIGVSSQRISNIERKALRYMARMRRKNGLASFIPDSCLYRHNSVTEFNRTWTSSTELAALKVYEEITGHALH